MSSGGMSSMGGGLDDLLGLSGAGVGNDFTASSTASPVSTGKTLVSYFFIIVFIPTESFCFVFWVFEPVIGNFYKFF